MIFYAGLSRRMKRRCDCLRETHARVKFLSLEPLLGPLYTLNLINMDWVIVGGESGPKARPPNPVNTNSAHFTNSKKYKPAAPSAMMRLPSGVMAQ